MKDKFIQTIKNKWLRSAVSTIVLMAIIIAIYLAINLWIEKVEIEDIDVTKEKIFSLSQATKDRIESLETDITIYTYHMSEYHMDFAYKYAKLSDHIKVESLENLEAKTSWKSEYGVSNDSSFIMIATENKEKLLYNDDLYSYNFSTGEQIDVTEEALTNGILDLITNEKPKVYFLTGHNLYPDDYFQYLRNSLVEDINEVENVNLITTGKVPEDCNVLIITALREDIKGQEKDALIKYIKRGGKILLLLDPNLDNIKLTNFQKVLDEYGISVSNGIILEGESSRMAAGAPHFVISSISGNSGIIKNTSMDFNVCLMSTGKLNIESTEELEKKNVTSNIIGVVSAKAFHRTELSSSSKKKIESDEDASGSPIAAIMTKKIDDNTYSKLVAFPNTIFATNMGISQDGAYALDLCNNKDVLLNSVSYLAEREEKITIRKNIDLDAIAYDVTETQNRIILTVICIVPMLIILIGIAVWLMRRRK